MQKLLQLTRVLHYLSQHDKLQPIVHACIAWHAELLRC